MNLHNASFLVSAVTPLEYPNMNIPEFVFVGRSNVGKSSLINKLLNRKSLARVSSTPGKTVTINFYNIDDTIMFVDLPGYGYASRSKSEIKKWGEMIETYLNTRRQICKIFLLVDSRHKPTTDDKLMLEWLRVYQRQVVVIATKTDKLSKKELEKNLDLIYKALELTEEDTLIGFSTKSQEASTALWDIIRSLLEAQTKTEN